MLKHEYEDGEIFAMAGGSRRHNALASRVSAALEAARGPGCVAFQSDQKVRILATGRATYPDATLVCGRIEGDPADPLGATITNPTLLVEVLSPSTEQKIAATSGSTTSSSRRCRSTCWSARARLGSNATGAFLRVPGSTRTRRTEPSSSRAERG